MPKRVIPAANNKTAPVNAIGCLLRVSARPDAKTIARTAETISPLLNTSAASPYPRSLRLFSTQLNHGDWDMAMKMDEKSTTGIMNPRRPTYRNLLSLSRIGTSESIK